MDFEAMQRLWRSPANEPDPDVRAAMIAQAHIALSRRRSRLRRLIVFAAVALSLPLALIALELIVGGGAIVDLRAQWALIPLVAIPAAILLLVARSSSNAMVEGSLLSAFRALKADNAKARARIVVIGAAMLVFVPALGVVLNQLVATGQMAAHELASAMAVLFGALALSALWMIAKYLLQLRPEAQRLDSLLRQYEAAP